MLRYNFDLIFLIDEEKGYEQNLERSVYELVEHSLSNPYKNKNFGIFILNEGSMNSDETATILTLAKVVFDTSLGSLEEQINLAARASAKDIVVADLLPQNYKSEPIGQITAEKETLELYNGFGGFSAGGKKYEISLSIDKVTPLPWSNVISNETFGTLVTESGLGFTWNKNSQMNKITPWSNDYVVDPQGEIIYLKDLDSGDVFSATPLPTKKSEFRVIHSQGYSEFIGKYAGLEHTLRVHVDKSEPIKILKLTITNASNKARRLECTYFAEFVLGTNRTLTQENLDIRLDQRRQDIYAQNPFADDFANEISLMALARQISTVTVNRQGFLGRSYSTE